MRLLRGLTMLGGVAVLCGGLAAYAAAQTPLDVNAPPAGYGPGMMGGWGSGPGMMSGWKGGPGGPLRPDMFAVLKQELNITAAQSADWDAYAATVGAADQAMWAGMRALRPKAGLKAGPDERFAVMSQIIELRKESFDKKHAAAEALLAHLTAFQSGQASEILPGLAEGGGMAGCGWGPQRGGMWPGMMGFDGPPL